jgi:hypothetical protein
MENHGMKHIFTNFYIWIILIVKEATVQFFLLFLGFFSKTELTQIFKTYLFKIGYTSFLLLFGMHKI